MPEVFCKNALGGPAPAAWASPGCDNAVLPASGESLITGNTASSYTPPPPRGQGWRKGGSYIFKTRVSRGTTVHPLTEPRVKNRIFPKTPFVFSKKYR